MFSWQNKRNDCNILHNSVPLLPAVRFFAASRRQAKKLRYVTPPLLLTSLLTVPAAYAQNVGGGKADGAAFEFGHQDIQSLQFSRKTDSDISSSEIQTELSFKLSPGKFDFSSAGVFGLSGVFANPELEIVSRPSGKYRIQESFPDLHNGLSYSAGIKIEHEDEDLVDTAYVSSGQLGLSYGRLGQVWYSGVDLSIGQFSSLNPQQHSTEVLSLDFTTGRKVGLTGVGPHAPLWLFSLQGNFDIQSGGREPGIDEPADWYLNPSLYWQNPDFTFAAQLQVPVDGDVLKDFEEPDYRLRALFEKHFR